jgi:hypothetical protein
VKGLRNFGVRVLMSGASMVAFGEPTGAVGQVVAEFAQEIVQHVILEHSAKLATGIGRMVIGRDAGDLGPDELKLLRGFIEALAEAAENFDPQSAARDITWRARTSDNAVWPANPRCDGARLRL